MHAVLKSGARPGHLADSDRAPREKTMEVYTFYHYEGNDPQIKRRVFQFSGGSRTRW